MVIGEREHRGWVLREYGDPDAGQRLLLLPGALCTGSFYDDVAAELLKRETSLRLVAATLPGHGGTEPPEDVSTENYAHMARDLSRDLGCDVVVGHSMGANVAIEMARARDFAGPLVLLSPSFSRQDESMFLRVMDRLGTFFGALPMRVMLALIGPEMGKLRVTDDRRDELVRELRKNDPRVIRRLLRASLDYLDRRDALAQDLAASGAASWVVFGDHGDVGLTADERAALEDCPSVSLIEVPEAGHMTLNEQPAVVADIVLQAVAHARS